MNKLIKTLALLLVLVGAPTAQADRIKDLVSIAANRGNQLIGYGLVVGLQGTGDGTDLSFTTQSMKTLLNRLGVNSENPLTDFEAASSGAKIDLKNVDRKSVV
jgi:flagellar P-ring protein precursor FlgI